MTPLVRIAAIATLACFAAACSIGSLVGGGSKAPDALYILTPEAPMPASASREAPAGEAVTVRVPVVGEELRTTRVPVHVGDTQVEYLTDLIWVDTPDELFRALVEETIRRTTSRVVLDPKQTALDPGLVLSGKLWRFGYDAPTGEVVVRFDGVLATQGGTHVETRVFESRVPAVGTAESASVALNRAANQVAMDVARWIGG